MIKTIFMSSVLSGAFLAALSSQADVKCKYLNYICQEPHACPTYFTECYRKNGRSDIVGNVQKNAKPSRITVSVKRKGSNKTYTTSFKNPPGVLSNYHEDKNLNHNKWIVEQVRQQNKFHTAFGPNRAKNIPNSQLEIHAESYHLPNSTELYKDVFAKQTKGRIGDLKASKTNITMTTECIYTNSLKIVKHTKCKALCMGSVFCHSPEDGVEFYSTVTCEAKNNACPSGLQCAQDNTTVIKNHTYKDPDGFYFTQEGENNPTLVPVSTGAVQ